MPTQPSLVRIPVDHSAVHAADTRLPGLAGLGRHGGSLQGLGCASVQGSLASPVSGSATASRLCGKGGLYSGCVNPPKGREAVGGAPLGAAESLVLPPACGGERGIPPASRRLRATRSPPPGPGATADAVLTSGAALACGAVRCCGLLIAWGTAARYAEHSPLCAAGEPERRAPLNQRAPLICFHLLVG